MLVQNAVLGNARSGVEEESLQPCVGVYYRWPGTADLLDVVMLGSAMYASRTMDHGVVTLDEIEGYKAWNSRKPTLE